MIYSGYILGIIKKRMNMFEYDSQKSIFNKKKHGIDFLESTHLWNDPFLVRFPAKNIEGEERWAYIGQWELKYWTVIVTHRGNLIRIISCRRARENEKEIYENQKKKI